MNFPSTCMPQEILGSSGPIAEHFDEYEPRQPQIDMCEAVMDSMTHYKHLFCEAGTGTGKSYAFLIPAIYKALNGGGPVIISTNTIALQQQIFEKDIPDLKKFLKIPHLKVVLRKGRSNYLSKRRLFNANNHNWEVNQITEIEDIENWAGSTTIGTIQDLNFKPNNEVWDRVKSDQYDCLSKRCPKFSKCFYFKSKKEAEEAHLIITNHSLLALDLFLKHKSEGTVTLLPSFKHLIIDEAHTLEDSIRKAGTFEWRRGSASRLAARGTNPKEHGFLDQLLKIQGVSSKCVIHASEARKLLKEFESLNNDYFDNTVGPYLKQFKKRGVPDPKRLLRDEILSPTGHALLKTLNSFNNYLESIIQELTISASSNPKLEELLILIKNYYEYTVGVFNSLKRITNAKSEFNKNHVSYIEASKYKGVTSYILINAPIFIKNICSQILFDKIPNIVLTSATLTINNSFKAIGRALGANNKEKLELLLLPPVFDYKNQVDLYLTSTLPIDPYNDKEKREKYYDKLTAEIVSLVDKTNGNAFILCNSNLLMNALHDRTKAVFERKNYNVLLQHGDLTREQMIHEFKTVENSVLFGVESFWTGVDIPGSRLQNVIIPKIPFPPPNPLSEAQEEIYRKYNQGRPRNQRRFYFSEKTVPDVAIRLKQGFGRLIRRKTDTGIVAILDSRVLTKPYGQQLLNSLPPCNIVDIS